MYFCLKDIVYNDYYVRKMSSEMIQALAQFIVQLKKLCHLNHRGLV